MANPTVIEALEDALAVNQEEERVLRQALEKAKMKMKQNESAGN